MNQNRKEELLTRWIDDALSDAEKGELEALLAEHPELRRERDDYLHLRDELQTTVPSSTEPPYPDFFNAHLERLVKNDSRAEARSAAGSSLLRRLFGWWLAPAAVGALVLAFLAGLKLGRPDSGGVVGGAIALPPAAYSPLTNVTAEARLDPFLDATVIVLDGLADLTEEEVIGAAGPPHADEVFVISATQAY